MGMIAIASLASKFERLGMHREDLDELVQFFEHRPRVLAGADVIQASNSAKHSTLLLAGLACSYKRLEDGSRRIYSFQYPGDFCDMYRYMLPGRGEAIAVQALTDCSVATIDHADIERLLAQRPRLGLALWRAAILEGGILRERLSNARRSSVIQRIARLLCEQLARREAIGMASPVVPIAQLDIADAVALSIVEVDRTVQELRNLNVLSKASDAIEIVDREQLEKIAEFDGRYLNVARLVSGWAVQTEGTRG
jgi:CRP-like cAMP-binding protein